MVPCPAACTEEQGKLCLYRNEVDWGPPLFKTLTPVEARQPKALQHPPQAELSWPPGLAWRSLLGKALARIAMRGQVIWEWPHSTAGGDPGRMGGFF